MKISQTQIKRAIADYVNAYGQYGVVMNIAGIPIKGDTTKLRGKG